MNTDVGELHLMEVYGFVLSDPFEALLEQISVEYLENGWRKLNSVLQSFEIEIPELRFGWLHPGLARIDSPISPISYMGWVTQQKLEGGGKRFQRLSEVLSASIPRLSWGFSIEGGCFLFDPSYHSQSLIALIEYSTEEVSVWNPEFILTKGNPTGLWRRIVQSIHQRNQRAFENNMQKARIEYSPVGYEILERGFNHWMKKGIWEGWLHNMEC